MEKRERRIVAQEKVQVKRPMVGVSLGYPLFEDMKIAAGEEPVNGMAAFVLELARYGWNAYRRVGSLKELKAMEHGAAETKLTSKRISAERCAMLAAALNMILDEVTPRLLKPSRDT